MLFVQYPSWIHPEIVPFLPVRWYGLMYVFSFITCYVVILSQIKKEKNTRLEEILPSLFMWIFLGMLIGARIVSEIVYSQNISILIKPWMIIWPFQNGRFTGIQGMSYHGGVIGIIIAVFIFCRIYRINFVTLADRVAIGSALSYTFGRLGNFTNGELYGRITTSPLGMIFPKAEMLPIADSRVAEVANEVVVEANQLGLVNLPRHPSQLYESLFEGVVIWVILALIYRYVQKRNIYVPGTIVALYIICYGIARFIIEYFRQPDTGLDFVIRFSDISNPNWLFVSLFNFTTGQVLSFVMTIIGLGFLIILILVHKQKKKKLRIQISP